MRLTLLLVLSSITLLASSGAASSTVFPPLEAWKQAVAAGDSGTLKSLYSTDPRRQLVFDRQPETLDGEVNYWTHLRDDGVNSVDPKILSIEDKHGAEQLIMRVSAKNARGERLVGSLVQIWTKSPAGWRIAASMRSDLIPDKGRALPEPQKPNPSLYPPTSEARAEIKSAEAEAAREHKRVLVVFGANWCYDCHVLDTTLRSTEFRSLVDSNYVVVHINTGDEGKDNNDLAGELGVALDHGIPALAVLEPSGKVIVAQKNGEFESTTRIGPQDIRDFLEKWKPRRG